MKRPLKLVIIFVYENSNNKNKKSLMKLKNIKIESTNKVLSANGGLIFFHQLLNNLNFEKNLKDVLPSKAKNIGISQYNKFKTLLLGFIAGLDSIDDVTDLKKDKLFSKLTDGACADSTMGDFLRSFSKKEIKLLNEFMLSIAMKLRSLLFSNDKFVIYSTDATPNEQTGQKIEGVGWNYKKQWGLDTLGLYDHHGFHYCIDIRYGGTHSCNGVEAMMEPVFSKTPNNLKKFFHADSAYGSLSVYNLCITKNTGFVIALKENVYGSLLDKYGENIKWKKTDIEFFSSNECEIGQCLYPLTGLVNNKTYLRVVFIRAPKQAQQLDLLYNNTHHYYAFVTNLGEHELIPIKHYKKVIGKRGKEKREFVEWRMKGSSIENIIQFYRTRGNTENFIKEEKGGLDLKHYPCQKLNANKVFGTVGAIAYNLMRFSSFLISKHGCYSKKIRRKLVNISVQVVRSARSTTLKFYEPIYQEVCEKLKTLHSMFRRFSNSC